MTPKLMRRYAVHSELGVGLVASSFALGRFCTTSFWPILAWMNLVSLFGGEVMVMMIVVLLKHH